MLPKFVKMYNMIIFVKFRFYDYWEVTKQNCKTGKPQKYIVLVTELMTSGNGVVTEIII